MRSKYWIVGGEYQDTAFDRMVAGTEQLIGPFQCRDKAMDEWKKLATATRSNCHARYTIAEEFARAS
jgi:hypothetical protein